MVGSSHGCGGGWQAQRPGLRLLLLLLLLAALLLCRIRPLCRRLLLRLLLLGICPLSLPWLLRPTLWLRLGRLLLRGPARRGARFLHFLVAACLLLSRRLLLREGAALLLRLLRLHVGGLWRGYRGRQRWHQRTGARGMCEISGHVWK